MIFFIYIYIYIYIQLWSEVLVNMIKEGSENRPRTTAGELQKIVESQGQKTHKKKLSNSTYIATCCLGGFQEKLSDLIQKQTPVYSVIRHDWNLWDWLLWSDETKKLAF